MKTRGSHKPGVEPRTRWDVRQRKAGWGLARPVTLLILILVVIGALVWGTSDSDLLANARREGRLRIGYAVEAPYAYLTPDGRVTGESPETARVIASRLGISHVEWRLTEFGRLIEGLESRRFDVIASGMLITPERARRVAFSSPTFRAQPGLLVRKGNPHRLHSHADAVDNPAVRLAVLSGSVEERQLLRIQLPPGQLVRVPDARAGLALLTAGQVDGLALTTPTLRWILAQADAGDFELANPFAHSTPSEASPPGWGAFAFRKEDRILRSAWDSELKTFVGSEEHRSLVGAFGFGPAELPDAAADAEDALPR